MEYNSKKSRPQKKRDTSKNSKPKNKEPLLKQNSPQTEKSNVSMGNVKPQDEAVNEHQNVVKKDVPDIPNLKRETDEIKRLTQKTPKSLRFVTSNWNRCDDQPVRENIPPDGDDLPDFSHLLSTSGGHFKFKIERDWDASLSILCEKPILKPNSMAGSLACIPIHTKLDMPNSMFSYDEREETHYLSKNNILTYNIRKKNKNNHILQEVNLKVDGNINKSNNTSSISNSGNLKAAVCQPDLASTSTQVGSASNNSGNIKSAEVNLENVTELCTDECLEDGKTEAKVYDKISISQCTPSLVDEIQTVGNSLHECALNENINTEICHSVEQNVEIPNSNTVKRSGATKDEQDISDDDLEFLLSLKKPGLEPIIKHLYAPTIEDISIPATVKFSTVAVKSTGDIDDWLEALCTEDDD